MCVGALDTFLDEFNLDKTDTMAIKMYLKAKS